MKLRQWKCLLSTTVHTKSGDREYFFTPETCDPETALAIACAMFGSSGQVREVEDEGVFTQKTAEDHDDDPYPERIWPECEMN